MMIYDCNTFGFVSSFTIVWGPNWREMIKVINMNDFVNLQWLSQHVLQVISPHKARGFLIY